MIYGLKWNHPAIVFFALNLAFGGWAAYLESMVIPGTFAVATRGLPWPLLIVGLVIISWVPLYMIARPSDWLPQRSLAGDERTYLRREILVQRIGYALNLGWLGFVLYRFWQMLRP